MNMQLIQKGKKYKFTISRTIKDLSFLGGEVLELSEEFVKIYDEVKKKEFCFNRKNIIIFFEY